MYLTREEINKQSHRTYNKWKEIWDFNAKTNSEIYKINGEMPQHTQIENHTDKSAIIISFGPSFEENIKKIKAQKAHYKHDVIVIDKALGYAIKAGIIPKYVVTADARLPFSECVDESISDKILSQVKLFHCAISHPSWVKKWKEIHGVSIPYVLKDGIKTQKIYRDYFDYRKKQAILIPASTNVGNTACVISCLILNYKLMYLAAFDYSFDIKHKYYGVGNRASIHRDFGQDKIKFDYHITIVNRKKELVATSAGMLFSAKWLSGFIQEVMKNTQKIFVNVTGSGILQVPIEMQIA